MTRLGICSLVGSFMLHALAIGGLEGELEVRAPRPAVAVLDFEITREAVPPEPPPRAELPSPAGASLAAAAPPRPAAPSPESPATPTAPEVAEAPAAMVDLSGITLSNAEGNGWAMPSGDGSARAGVLGPVGRRPSPPHAPAPAPSQQAERDRDWVAARDLSERPLPPALARRLQRLYPAEARRRAISGSASLRVRIDADGRVRKTTPLRESFAGFAEACRQALLGSRWTPPRDRTGRAVATEVRYTCEFVIE